ncbi:Protein disulfide-isomerase 5-1 [Dendrobium catenatum]|uniref:Protein disulfide-isomerase 5-1 n=1 Tax=Dendrobium catenatum TaxID=906689 RepID=A0A2I0VQF5_9ASPA|nr:Protein disulfide-isomerase 5-1 [Dendrobium catenatum]
MELFLRRPTCVLLILVLLPIAFRCSNGEVVTLTADTFTDKKIEVHALVDISPNIDERYYCDVNLSSTSRLEWDLMRVKEKDTVWFVKFCVPWCKYCKKLGTLWEDLGKAVEAEDEIEVGEVDCSLNKAVCTKVDIHSYPTFKIFYDGEEFAKYQGKKDVELLKAFVLKEADKATKSNLEDDQDEL